MSIWIIFKLLGSLALLMFGMKSMSEALQKMAGPQLRHVLGAMTTNRFTGMLTGMLVTASVQSSTATTVMTVSFVNAGLLTLAQAISVIMGANIGTTLTAWIMSAGMSFDITSAVYPAFFLGIILIYLKKYRYIGDFLFGLSFLLLGLGTLRMTGTEMHLGENQTLLNFFASFDPDSFVTTLNSDQRVWARVATIPIINKIGSTICQSGTCGTSASATGSVNKASASTASVGMGIDTVSCRVITQSGNTNEATAVVSSTMRFTRWNVSRASIRR